MSRMFCTLKEAAETLHASEDQIRMLLEEGLLREFREGPHRLLKQADVGALASVGERHVKGPPPAALPAEIQQPPAPRRADGKANRPAATMARPHDSRPADAGRLGPAGRRPTTEDRSQRTESRGRNGNSIRPPKSVVGGPSSVVRDTPRRSVRQWFWMGLVQDRPVVIALLSCLILLGLSALAAGLCFVAETL